MGFFSKLGDVVSGVKDVFTGDWSGALSNFSSAVGLNDYNSLGPGVQSGNSLMNYLGAGAVGLASGLGTSLLNNYFSRQAASKEYQYTTNLMNYQNEYNTPLAQRQRLIEAGYNPNLFYNTGANSSASGSVRVQAPKAGALDLLAAYNVERQNELLDAQTRNAISQGLLTGRKANIEFYNEKYAEREYDIFKKTGKIPESYYGNMNTFGNVMRGIEYLSQFFSK